MLAVYLQWIQSFSSDLSLHSSILLHLSFRDLISSPLSQRNNSSEMCLTSCIPGTVKNIFLKGAFPISPSHVHDVHDVGSAWQAFEREGRKTDFRHEGSARGFRGSTGPLKIHLCLNILTCYFDAQ